MLQITASLFKHKLMKYQSNLFCLAYSWCNNRDTAQDLTQESLEKALAKRHQLTNPDAIKSWLAKILSNCWKDHLRRQKPNDDIETLSLASDYNLETEHERDQIVIKVRDSIDQLPLSQRQVITLVDIFELSYAEVAKTLDIPIGTVMSRLSRARQQLRHQLVDYRNENTAPATDRNAAGSAQSNNTNDDMIFEEY